MTFRDFSALIADRVQRSVPRATYQPPFAPADPAVIALAGAKATITREKAGWRISFSRSGGGVSMASLAGEKVEASTAANVADSICGFLN
jgi:hypothetical protein